MKEVKKTSFEWNKQFNYEIIEPDGWDRSNYNYSFKEQKITLEEFEKRISLSTVINKNPKREFVTNFGCKIMFIDCFEYEVEITKGGSRSIIYKEKKTKSVRMTPHVFDIDWDDEKDGGRIEIKFKDGWGSEMIFIHYMPSDIKGMFDFIGKGYNIFDDDFLS